MAGKHAQMIPESISNDEYISSGTKSQVGSVMVNVDMAIVRTVLIAVVLECCGQYVAIAINGYS